MGAAANLATWLSSLDPEAQTDPALFERFLDDESIEVPTNDELFDDDPVAWVKEHYADDFATWFDNSYDLAERFEVVRNNDNIEGGGQLGRGTWFVHFTSAEFTQFTDGVTRQFIGESGRAKDRVIACPQNLTLPPDRQKWVHAYTVFDEISHSGDLDTTMLYEGVGYGRNALLFRSDEGVLGKHFGHDHYMAFVLGCSEYDAVLLTELETNHVSGKWGRDKRTLAGVAQLVHGDVEFEDLEQLIDALEQSATRVALGGRRRRTRWHRLARY